MVVFRSSRRLDFLGVALFSGSLCAGIALASPRALGVAVAGLSPLATGLAVWRPRPPGVARKVARP
jgi:hypothetical protein